VGPACRPLQAAQRPGESKVDTAPSQCEILNMDGGIQAVPGSSGRPTGPRRNTSGGCSLHGV